jgi:hypothetical protein
MSFHHITNPFSFSIILIEMLCVLAINKNFYEI